MSRTSSTPDCVAPEGNQTNGMPRRSAYRICRPYFGAEGDTSQAIPRARNAVATARLAERCSSSGTATRTQLGVGRLDAISPRANSGPRVRVTPNEIPTPGYVVRPSVASES